MIENRKYDCVSKAIAPLAVHRKIMLDLSLLEEIKTQTHSINEQTDTIIVIIANRKKRLLVEDIDSYMLH